ncbi:tyrosine-protein phosphatase [Seohaeicola saemankumensis]|uniref:phosphatase domain-containing putative toxin n=1 Tax=Seohaeicola saemankumensis TaxID=481181 RepID=UPI001E398CD8|nr:tyrosine-protein phosphatase [Seohaeicola saemankumensis]MCD1627069.1 tyrosine-protein phosphatase [Seohaeicola saemankumensis]
MIDWRDRLHNFWIDQGVVRLFWTNSAEVAPGVYRSNQPGQKRLAAVKEKGVRSVLYLRGNTRSAPFRAEAAACKALGLDLHVFHMSAHRLPDASRIMALIDVFRQIEKPILMHCRAGADRTGLASAIYLLALENASIEDARSMLSAQFGHWSWTSTGLLDQLLHHYDKDQKETGSTFVEWVQTRYDPAFITREFSQKSAVERFKLSCR